MYKDSLVIPRWKRIMRKSFAVVAAFTMIFNFGITSALLTPHAAQASPNEESSEKTCPQGNVKYEIDTDDYEYNDGSGTISGDEDSVSWSVTPGYTLTDVCIKIGGSHGGELIHPNPSDESYDKEDYNISHVVLYTEQEEPQEGTIHIRKDVRDQDLNPIDTDDVFYLELNGDDSTVTEFTETQPAIFTVPVGVTQTLNEVNINPNYEFVLFNKDEDLNTPGAQITVTEAGETVYVLVKNKEVATKECNFEIVKEGPATADVNGNITYIISYDNNGTANCTGGGVKITDYIPAGTEYVSHNATPAAGSSAFDANTNRVWWNLGTVTPGESGEVTLTVKVLDGEQCEGWQVDNIATFWSNQMTGESNHVYTDVEKRCSGDLRIKKYNDLNGNGQKDSGESYMTGWDFEIKQGDTVVASGTTGQDAQYSPYLFINNLPTGSYNVVEIPQTGWTNTDPGNNALTKTVTIQDNALTNVWFGNTRDTGDLRIKKYNDLNGNGEWDDSEPFMSNWKFTVTQNDNFVDEGITDTNGQLLFSDLPAGTYDITETQQNGWTNTTALVQDATVIYNDTTTKYFGNFELGKISGHKFEDVNANGTWDQGEPALVGWTINLDNGSSDVTDANGYYEFTGLVADDYNVTEAQQNGWHQTTTNPSTITIQSGSDVKDIDFGNFEKAQISGHKFEDINGNGVWDTGEPTLENWIIYISGNWATSTTTDANGYYKFDNLNAGDWTITENEPVGWLRTYPVNPGSHTETITSGSNIKDVNFGNFELGKIFGYKWDDVDGDGVYTQGTDLSLSGWEICITGLSCTTTNANGYYEFTDLQKGTYEVYEKFNALVWYPISPLTSHQVEILSGDEKRADFFNFAYGEISGYKFEDVNANGVWDKATENGLSNWEINLDDGSKTLTDRNGFYKFNLLKSGTYTVTETDQPSWTQTTPDPNPITITSGKTVKDVNFGNYKSLTVSGNKYVDVNGDGSITDGILKSGWTIYATNGNIVKTTITNGNGYYEFNFGPLDAGDWTIYEDISNTAWTQTYPASGDYDIVVKSGTDISDRDFGNFELGKISGYKFEDVDGDGNWDIGEPALVGWTINLDNGDSDVTDVNGYYKFTGLTAGDYNLSETQQTGWIQTTVNPAIITIISGTDSKDNNFGNFELGKISGYKYDDKQNPLSDWYISLDNGDYTWTYPNGYYEFNNLEAGDYVVTEDNPLGWTQLSPTSDNGTYPITIESGTDSQNNDFENRLNEFEVDIEKLGPATVDAGDQMTYTLNWEITGNTTVYDATIKDLLPANTTFVSASNGGTENAGTITWDLGDVTPNESGTVTLTVLVATPLTNGSELYNDAQICGSGDILDNEWYSSLQTGERQGFPVKCDDDNTTTIVESAPVLSVEKTNDNPLIAPTEIINYEVFWSVAGNSQATNVTLTDSIPVEINVDETTISHSGTYDSTTRTITWDLGTHIPGNTGSVTYSATSINSIPNGTQIINVVKITSVETDPIFWEAQSVTTVESDPVLGIVKDVDYGHTLGFANPGDTVTYTVQVTNTGTDTAKKVVLDDTLPAGFLYADTLTPTRSWNLGDIAVGDSITKTYDVIIGTTVEAGFYDNIAVAYETESDEKVEDDATVEVRVPTPKGETTKPILTIDKTVNVEFVNPGDTVTYTVVISNNGDGAALNVVLTDTLPAEFTFEDGTKTRSWALGTILAGTSQTVVYNVLVGMDVEPGEYLNLAVAKADNHDAIEDIEGVEVRNPRVLGDSVPLTGAGLQDLILFLASLLFIFAGVLFVREGKRQYQTN